MAKVASRAKSPADLTIAREFGVRLRQARQRGRLTQSALAGDRYTKAYISALENGLAKPSMAALTYLAQRLGVAPVALLAPDATAWTRLEADIRLAAGDWQAAADAYGELLADATETGIRAELLRGLAEALCRLGRGLEAIRAAEEARELFIRLGRPRDAAVAIYWLSAGHHQADSPREARRLLEELLDQIETGLDVEPDLRARCLIALAAGAQHDGDQQRALAYLEQARVATARMDDRRRATFLWALASAYRDSGDLEAALRAGRQSQGLYRAAAAQREAASITNDLALTYLGLGNTAQAAALAGEARAEFEALDDPRWLAHVVETQARVSLAQGAAARAEAEATEAIGFAEATGNAKALSSALVTRARARQAGGSPEGAVEDFSRAAELARDKGSRARRAEILSAWAEMLAGMGRHEEAYRLAAEALA